MNIEPYITYCRHLFVIQLGEESKHSKLTTQEPGTAGRGASVSASPVSGAGFSAGVWGTSLAWAGTAFSSATGGSGGAGGGGAGCAAVACGMAGGIAGGTAGGMAGGIAGGIGGGWGACAGGSGGAGGEGAGGEGWAQQMQIKKPQTNHGLLEACAIHFIALCPGML